jgi:hypothetical protein
MPATITFRFHDYELRPTDERDFVLAETWTLADPFHRDTVLPTFWFDQEPQSESYLLTENLYGPVFFFKMMRTRDPHIIELHIQFPPPGSTPKNRLMSGLKLGLEWLEKQLSDTDITTVFFESRNPTLIQFCVRYLAFEQQGSRLVKALQFGPTGKGNGKCAEPQLSRRA